MSDRKTVGISSEQRELLGAARENLSDDLHRHLSLADTIEILSEAAVEGCVTRPTGDDSFDCSECSDTATVVTFDPTADPIELTPLCDTHSVQ